jgi:predicted TIM-barrel fold metal-dependent hydrolase
VYTDISGLVLGDFHDRFEKYMLVQMQEMLLWGVNPRYVLYGTDWPISSMETYLQFIEEIKMPIKDRRRILYENAAELYGIPVKDETSVLGSLFK